MSEVRAMASADTEIVVSPERLCRVLELAISDKPLEQTLGELIRIVESTSRTGVLGSILLLDEDGKHLRHGAAPSLPDAYCEAIDGAEIGPCVGSCGTAAYTSEPVFVSDIANDPLWADFRELADCHGLRACWSTPIMKAGRKVLGTFAMYHREPREPTIRDLALVDLVTHTAALVIDRKRTQDALGRIAAMTGVTAA
jgi:GAF domain-containing protein